MSAVDHLVPHTHINTHIHVHTQTHSHFMAPASLSLTILFVYINCKLVYTYIQLKNMVSALFQCRPKSASGTREFLKGGHHFGWKSIEDMYKRELVRIQNGQITRVPKLKESYVQIRGHG